MAYVSKQPTASIMDPQLGEKTADCCLNHQSCTTGNGHCPHRKCHRSRFRRFILPITLILLILVAGLFALSCLQDSHFSDWGVDGLLPRAFGNDNTNGGSFTNHKCMWLIELSLKLFEPFFILVYLVVVFGGLLVLFVLGVLLSFWCCRGT